MPMMCPRRPTYWAQPNVEACSTATRAVTAGGSTLSRYSGVWSLEQFPRRHAHHPRLIPSALSFSYASTASATSLPVASRRTSGLPSGASARMYAPWPRPRRQRTCVRSSVGRACRRQDQRDWLVVQLHDDLPGLRHFVGVGRAQHDQPGNRPQRGKLLDRLVRRPVFADADRIVRENVDHRHFHEALQPDRRRA